MSRSASEPKRRWSDPFLKGRGRRAWLTYLGVRGLFAFLQILPLQASLDSARVVVAVWKRIMPRHRRHALTHLRQSLGAGYSERQLQQIADTSMESVIRFAIELVCMPRRINRFSWSRYIELSNFDDALRILLEGRGAVMVTGHYGSFEIMGHLLAALGFPMVAVMRPIDNQYVNEFVVASRRTNGLTLIDKKGASAHAEEHLGRGALVGFIGDQDAGRKGMFVDFFGRPASAYKSIGLLAMAMNVPVIVGYARRLGESPRYRVGVQRILYPRDWGPQDDPLRWITQQYTAAIEEIVRDEPRQYLWIHRRWKSQPPERRAAAPGAVTMPTG